MIRTRCAPLTSAQGEFKGKLIIKKFLFSLAPHRRVKFSRGEKKGEKRLFVVRRGAKRLKGWTAQHIKSLNCDGIFIFLNAFFFLLSSSVITKYNKMKFKWQLNFDTIWVMCVEFPTDDGERNEKRNTILWFFSLSPSRLTCVNFNELAFIIYHVLSETSTSHSPPSLSCCVALANCDPPEILVTWQSSIKPFFFFLAKKEKANRFELGNVWDYFAETSAEKIV